MEKQVLYMHMGFPKTGSTSLQEFLFLNRERLKNNGICYPEPVRGVQLTDCHEHGHAHACCWFKLSDNTDWDHRKSREKFCNEIKESKCPLNIMSSENFVFEHTDNLSFYLSHFQVKPVYYLRNLFDYLSSLQKTFIRNCLRPDVFTFDYYRNLRILGSLRYQIDLFGMENCIFKNYDKIINDEIDLVEDFMKTLHIEKEGEYQEAPSINITPDDSIHAFLYQLSFLPFNIPQYLQLKKELYSLDMKNYRWYKFNPLPLAVFDLDEYALEAIDFQGRLLNDPDWLTKTIIRREALADIPYQDLPAEIQRYIFDNLSANMQKMLRGYMTIDNSSNAFLPSMLHVDDWKYNVLPLYINHAKNCRLSHIRKRI